MILHTDRHDLEVGQPLDPAHDQKHVDTTYDLDAIPNAITRKQLFYILGPHAMGAGIIDAVANFAIACAVYRTTDKEIRLWPLDKNTIAGDMGVTVLIQGILTMLITSALVHWDIRTGRIEPFEFAWPGTQQMAEKSRWRSYAAKSMLFLSPTQTLSLRAGRREFSKSLFILLLRGFVISAFYFLLFWPPAIAITAPLYGGIDMHGTWTPQAIKAVFGGVLGIAMNPLVAALVLGAKSQRLAPAPARKIVSTTSMTMRQSEIVSVARPPLVHVSPRA